MSYQDPSFDKAKYRKRRKKGLPGTEDLTPPSRVAKWTKEDYEAGKCKKDQIGKDRTPPTMMAMTSKGLKAYPRRLRRRKMKDRSFTSRGHVFGVPMNSKQHNLIKHHAKKDEKREGFSHETRELDARHEKLNLPKHDPSKTNHDRMVIRKKARKAKRELAASTQK